jgi:hypothetical protein
MGQKSRFEPHCVNYRAVVDYLPRPLLQLWVTLAPRFCTIQAENYETKNNYCEPTGDGQKVLLKKKTAAGWPAAVLLFSPGDRQHDAQPSLRGAGILLIERLLQMPEIRIESNEAGRSLEERFAAGFRRQTIQ